MANKEQPKELCVWLVKILLLLVSCLFNVRLPPKLLLRQVLAP